MGVKEPKNKVQAPNRLVWSLPPASQAITLRMLRIILKEGDRKNMKGLAHDILSSRKTTQKTTNSKLCYNVISANKKQNIHPKAIGHNKKNTVQW